MRVEGLVGHVVHPPTQPVLVFDARCDFCRRWVARLGCLDRDAAIRAVSLWDPSASQLTGEPLERLRLAAHVVRPDGAVFAGAAAAREAFRYLRWGWLVRGVLWLPGAMRFAEWVYGRVARTWGPVDTAVRE